MLFSLSNLFLSAAVGIACDRGFFDLEDRVVSFFPDKLTGDVSPYQYEMRFRHLLTMNAGHHDHNFHVIHPQADWVRAFLAIPPTHRPGTHYCYSKHVSHVLAAIVERTTGKGLVDFLMPRLFEPLGITNVQWETSPLGIAAGGMGLSVPTEGVARFGQLCFVAPAERVVVAVTSAKSNFRQITPLIYRCLLGRTSLQGSELSSQCDELNLDRLKTDSQNHDRQDDERDVLELLTPDESAAVNWNTSFDRADIRFDENSEGIQRVVLGRSDDNVLLEIMYQDGSSKAAEFGLVRPVHSSDVFVKDVSLHTQPVVRYARCCGEAQLELVSIYLETPYVTTYRVSFEGLTKATVEFSVNVSLRRFSPLSSHGFELTGERIGR